MPLNLLIKLFNKIMSMFINGRTSRVSRVESSPRTYLNITPITKIKFTNHTICADLMMLSTHAFDNLYM